MQKGLAKNTLPPKAITGKNNFFQKRRLTLIHPVNARRLFNCLFSVR